MNTEQLIDRLAADVPRIGANAVERGLGVGVVFGVALSFALLVATIGTRPDLAAAMAGSTFWMKWAYTLSLSAIALAATARLARPDAGSLRGIWLIAVPFAVIAAIATVDLISAPSERWVSLWLGHSWRTCPWRVLGLAAPIFIGLLWSFRRLAPTRLREAGAAAGLAAGACAATVYCLYCSEASALFLLTWYSLGILLSAAFGALVGPWVLRWR